MACFVKMMMMGKGYVDTRFQLSQLLFKMNEQVASPNNTDMDCVYYNG